MKLKLIKYFSFLFSVLVFFSIIFLLGRSLFSQTFAAESIGTWIPTKSLVLPHDNATATLLSDNKVLVLGYDKNTEIYNLQTQSWAVVNGALKDLHYGNTATLLNSGEVLITGLGNDVNAEDSQYGELFNSTDNTWRKTGNMINPKRIRSTASRLSDGRVLVAGGGFEFSSPSLIDTEIYDPITNSWTIAAPMNAPRNFHTGTVLQSGEVLVTGGGSIGNQGLNPLNSAEIYNTQSNTWSTTSNMFFARSGHTATLLPNGKVIVTGGFEKLDSDHYFPPLLTAELYDPVSKQWSQVKSMINSRAWHTATLLPNGKVLVAGGVTDVGTYASPTASAEIYDPTANTWAQVSSMNASRFFHGATLLEDGRAFVAGGSNDKGSDEVGNSMKSAEIFNPSSTADFKQTDPGWSTAPDLPFNYLTHLNHSLDCGDMYSYGCAVTSVADVFYSYGKIFLPDTSQLNPGGLNDWLTGHNGFTACSIIWGNVSATTKLGAPSIIFRNGSSDWIAGQKAIDNALNDGNLPIVGVYTSFGTHFFVLSEKLPDVNGKPDYNIVDPALYPFTPNNPGKTGKPLSQTYKFDNVFEVITYKKGSNPQKTLTIRGHSPIQLLVADPLGNTTGYDKTTQAFIENIPESSYGTESGIAPVDGQSAAVGETKYFQQINPSEGEYVVQLIGTREGSYSLDFSKTDEQGNVSLQEVHGLAKQEVTEIYHVQNTQNVTEPLVIKKEITFQKVIDDINELFNMDLITHKSVSNNLIRNIEQAEKASLPGNSKTVLQNLDQFNNILQREEGRRITERAYQILFDDVNFLKKQFINSQ